MKKLIALFIAASFLLVNHAYSQAENQSGLRGLSFLEKARPAVSQAPLVHPFLKRVTGVSEIELDPFTDEELGLLNLRKDLDGNTLDAGQLSEEDRLNRMSDAIARICDKRGIKFLNLYVRDPESDGIISYCIAPRRAIPEILSRGVAMDGSSLDPQMLSHILGKTLQRMPNIGHSDARAIPVVERFYLHKGPDHEASIELALYNADDPRATKPRKVNYKMPTVASPVIAVDTSGGRPYQEVYEEAIGKVEAAIRTGNITELTLLYGDMEGKAREYSLTATNPEELIARLKREEFFYSGIPFEGGVRASYVGEEYLPAEKQYTLLPKIPTFRVIPVGRGKRAVIIGQLQERGLPVSLVASHETALGYPRNALKAASGVATPKGDKTVVAPEIEFYLTPAARMRMPMVGYHRSFKGMLCEEVARDIIRALESIGEEVTYMHAEVGNIPTAVQFECVLGHGPAFTTITTKELHKWVVQEVARAHAFEALFDPKPFFGCAGSGMHLHISLRDPSTGRNLFYDPQHPNELSRMGKQYMAGIMKYIPELQFLINQTDNSYERLVPGYEAPVYRAWGRENRTAMIRVPAVVDPTRETRFELRLPDSGGNLYLVLLAIIVAGEAGIIENLNLDDYAKVELDRNLYYMSATEKAKKGIANLNSSLYEALYHAYHSDFVKAKIPREIRDYFFAIFKKRTHNLQKQLRRDNVKIRYSGQRRRLPLDVFISHKIVRKADIGAGTEILGSDVYINGSNIRIGKNTKIGEGVKIVTEGSLVKVDAKKELVSGTVRVGNDVRIGKRTKIIARDNGSVQIEQGCHIPPGTELIANQDQVVRVVKHSRRDIEIIKIENPPPPRSAISNAANLAAAISI